MRTLCAHRDLFTLASHFQDSINARDRSGSYGDFARKRRESLVGNLYGVGPRSEILNDEAARSVRGDKNALRKQLDLRSLENGTSGIEHGAGDPARSIVGNGKRGKERQQEVKKNSRCEQPSQSVHDETS